MNGVERLNRGAERCTVLVHPDDAASLGIADGSQIRVTSKSGSVTAPAQIDAAMMRGVVSMPHGHARASINELTGGPLDELTGNAAFSGVPVELSLV